MWTGTRVLRNPGFPLMILPFIRSLVRLGGLVLARIAGVLLDLAGQNLWRRGSRWRRYRRGAMVGVYDSTTGQWMRSAQAAALARHAHRRSRRPEHVSRDRNSARRAARLRRIVCVAFACAVSSNCS